MKNRPKFTASELQGGTIKVDGPPTLPPMDNYPELSITARCTGYGLKRRRTSHSPSLTLFAGWTDLWLEGAAIGPQSIEVLRDLNIALKNIHRSPPPTGDSQSHFPTPKKP